MNILAPMRLARHVSHSPAMASALTYLAGAGLTYGATSKWGARKIAEMYTRNMPNGPEREQAIFNIMHNIRKNRKLLTFSLPALPAAAVLAGTYDGKQPYFGWGSWDGVPKQEPTKPEAPYKPATKEDVEMDRALMAGSSQHMNKAGSAMEKYASSAYAQIMSMPVIPLAHSRDLVYNDPVLNDKQKGAMLNVFDKAPQAPMLSRSDVAWGAVRLGVGAAAGLAVGEVVGDIFGAPPSVTNKMSAVGAIGGALINSGVL